MSDTDSPLSDAPSDLDEQVQLKKSKGGILKFFTPTTKKAKKASSPPPIKRSMTPPRETVLADNEAIAFIVMFRSRFNGLFPKSLANFGPQEIERGVVDDVPSEQVEDLLCALLGLLLNRKQDVKRGHYNRALEEAVQTHKSQWPKDWETKNPLLGNTTFMSMSPDQRLTLLRALILWSLSSSEAVKKQIADSYKQVRHADDLNQPLSVQSWGSDGHERRYFLIEGMDDTHFRVYRETNLKKSDRQWSSVAGDIEELKGLAEKLIRDDNTKNAKSLSGKILNAIPRFEATEEKRRRREYRQARRNQFNRPVDTTFSMYEGRTRGKRMKYTFSEEEDDVYSDTATRRSTRNTRNHTPIEPAGPTITQSGRQVKARHGGAYGESILSGTHTPAVGGLDETLSQEDDEDVVGRRPRRAAAAAAAVNQNGKRSRFNSVDDMDDEEDVSEQDYGDDDEEEEEEEVPVETDVDEPISDDEEMEDAEDVEDDYPKQSMIVKLPIKTPTPEKKTNGIKLKLKFSSPSKHAGNPEHLIDPPSPASMTSEKATNNTTTETISTPNLSKDSSKLALLIKNGEVPSATSAAALKSPLPNSYISPERTNSFTPQAINVGSGGD